MSLALLSSPKKALNMGNVREKSEGLSDLYVMKKCCLKCHLKYTSKTVYLLFPILILTTGNSCPWDTE